MATQDHGGPPEETVTSDATPRADGEGDQVVAQQNVGLGEELGGGEFPPRDARPRGPEEVTEGDRSSG